MQCICCSSLCPRRCSLRLNRSPAGLRSLICSRTLGATRRLAGCRRNRPEKRAKPPALHNSIAQIESAADAPGGCTEALGTDFARPRRGRIPNAILTRLATLGYLFARHADARLPGRLFEVYSSIFGLLLGLRTLSTPTTGGASLALPTGLD